MKVSRTQLQEYFDRPLPSVEALSEAFTFHSFEIDSVEGDVLDVKVLPNRAADCGTEDGVARQLGAILDQPLKDEFQHTAPGTRAIATSLRQINAILGSDFSQKEVEDVFRRLRIAVTRQGDALLLTPPADRVDLTIPVDIAEEVGQIMGYDNIPPVELPTLDVVRPTSDVGRRTPNIPDQARYRGIERMKDQLVEQGYIEVSTRSFATKGDVELANPIDKTMPYLRTSLEANLNEALEHAKQYAPLVLPPHTKPKLFEVGTVFLKEGEHVELRMSERVEAWGEGAGTVDNLSIAKVEEYGIDYEQKKYALGMYKPFSLYPFITRDIAFWTPSGGNEGLTKSLISDHAGELLVRLDQFDQFEKEGRISLAFRLVFQSTERTLTDEEVNTIMQKVSSALTQKGYEIR